MTVYLVDHEYDGWSSVWSTRELADAEAKRLNDIEATHTYGYPRWSVYDLVLDEPGRAAVLTASAADTTPRSHVR